VADRFEISLCLSYIHGYLKELFFIPSNCSLHLCIFSKAMIRIAKFLRISRRQWENPRSSIGERRETFTNKKGTFTCWDAVGPVRDLWNRLRPEIKEYVDEKCEYGPALILEIYMIGRTEETAAPKILICSQNITARKGTRKAIKGSRILDNHPGIGLGDSPRPPGENSPFPRRLAQEDLELGLLQASYLGDETVVLSNPSDNAFGRRLFIPMPNGSQRLATAGPILHINRKVYQLTAGHALRHLDNSNFFEATSSSFDDCDFDGQSDSEEDDSVTAPETTDQGKSRDVLLPDQYNICSLSGGETDAESQRFTLPVPASSSSAATDHTLILSNTDVSAQDMPTSKKIAGKRNSKIPRRLERVGIVVKVAREPQQVLDYELIKLDEKYSNGRNELPCSPNSTQRWLRVINVAKIAKIGFADVVNVITMTASSGILRGKLYATASYIRLPNERFLQEVYTVRLDGQLADGDCGSGIIDRLDGHFYGHIVAGCVGTGLAYIVPGMKVFEDILARLGGDVALMPPVQPSPSGRFSKDRTGLEPIRIVEFASKHYFGESSEAVGLSEEGKHNSSSGIVSTRGSHFVRSVKSRIPGMQPDRNVCGLPDLPKQRERLAGSKRLPASMDTFRSKIWTRPPKTPASDGKIEGASRPTIHPSERKTLVAEMRRRPEEPAATSGLTFEQRFYALPGDLQVYIFANLSVPDILHLRLVAKSWNRLISLNEAPISRAYLQHNPVPRFAISLYPLPLPSEIDLRYIRGLWYRLLVASRLSAMMAAWIREEHFIRITEGQRLDFAPQQAHVCRRLVPLLFTILHFFESYHRLHVKSLFRDSQKSVLTQNRISKISAINPAESQIMSMYDNNTLLQVHQVFPLLTSYLSRKMRPPSYLGRVERSLRGYHKEKAPDHVLVAILCIGGLREVLRFSEIEEYDARRIAADDWYASLSQQPVNNGSTLRQRPMDLGRRQPAQATISPAESTSDNTASSHSSVFSSFTPGSNRNRGKRSIGYRSIVSDAGLAAGPPMLHFVAAETHRLLLVLPALEQLWIPTAEALLLQRQAVSRLTDIKRQAQVADELVREDITDADELIYGQDVERISGYEPLVWGGLLREVRGREGDEEGLVRWYQGPQII
jgi:hypothetical protein